ncbi:MAG: hypothetical protein ACJA0Z_000737 [Halioglobus sp.]|jgi:hypothetical protein
MAHVAPHLGGVQTKMSPFQFLSSAAHEYAEASGMVLKRGGHRLKAMVILAIALIGLIKI